MKIYNNKILIGLILVVLVSFGIASAAHIENEDVANSKHNLSLSGPADSSIERNVSSIDTDEICVFCHTPHGSNATANINPPIWNRFLSEANYTMYDQVWSYSFEGEPNKAGTPTGYSRLCLSCHDGTIALGTVLNAPGAGKYNTNVANPDYPMAIVGNPGIGGTMPLGGGANTGDTRRLGVDLTNDHPVSFKYDSTLAVKDDELVDPGALPASSQRGVDAALAPVKRFPGDNPGVVDSVQCTSCHNPHNTTYPKFLRASLYQDVNTSEHPTGEPIICLFCHNKPGWKNTDGTVDAGGELNTHAESLALHTPYPPDGASPGNPYDYDGSHTVREYACRNCHDPHTVQGATRLHREGIAADGSASIEATCYLCHSPNSGGVNLVAGTTPSPLFDLAGGPAAPDIYTQFSKDSSEGGIGSAMNLSVGKGHQPVFVHEPSEGVELLSPVPPAGNENIVDFTKIAETHVECTDCHNPHQVTGPRFSNSPNRMKGMKGIDIHGEVVGPGILGNDREVYIYEVCFRCHGNSYSQVFAGDSYPDDTIFRSSDTDLVTWTPAATGGTASHVPPQDNLADYGLPKSPANPKFSFSGFSNKRKEFNPDSIGSAPGLNSLTYNSAFHPVYQPGRNQSEVFDGTVASPLTNAFDPASGLATDNTIMCTDCHNTSDIDKNIIHKGPVTTSSPSTIRAGAGAGSLPTVNRNDILDILPGTGDDIVPNNEAAVGPHGSNFKRVLRGEYNTRSSSDCSGDPNADCRYFSQFGPTFAVTNAAAQKQPYNGDFELCFRCHNREVFIDGTSNATNFYARYNNIATNDKYDTLPIGSGTDIWNGNLHYLHINFSDAKCHDCHNNLHSNLEAPNTIYGDHQGDCTFYFSGNSPEYKCYPGSLPPNQNIQDDGPGCGTDDRCNKTSTHLVNFNPVSVTGNQSSKPRWYWGKSKWEKKAAPIEMNDPAQKYMNCDLRCHGRTMNECAYQYEIRSNIVSSVFATCVQ